MEELPKQYDPKAHEKDIYALWEKSGVFTPKINPKVKPFVISMPPANITGKLHIGHAMFVTIEDILTRYHRMKGEPTLWLPGTDHAGIATQAVVEKALKKEGLSRHKLGREKFVKRVWEWKKEYGGEITRQIRALGASCDWSRERFTLDEGLSSAVNEAFRELHDKGLIYQGLRTVNWCPRCHSAIADDEVEYRREKGKFYHIKYGPFVLASTRPETKLGDTAVAVHPGDKRYQKMVGKKYKIPGVLGEFEIVVVADNAVDPKFGTGAVKVTPAHSLVDFEIAQRHGVPMKQVIDENGRMMENTGKYAGLKTAEARGAIVADMQKMGLIKKIEENYEHNIGVCYRCGGVIEPIPSKQWFIKMKPLCKRAKEAVKSEQIKILPKRFEKVYFHWLDNIRDWCISRQLWWGHQIPVFYKKQEFEGKSQKVKGKSWDSKNCETDNSLKNEKMKIENSTSGQEIYVGTKPPKDGEWIQEEDVLDTWFSSALWPFSTLGWPESSSKLTDYQYFYPTTVLETGYDIIFFWVAKMIIMGLELTGKPPFQTVYLHGLVRDEHNRKMSKSLGNVLLPSDMSQKFGTDALRMALIIGTAAGNDTAVGEHKIKGYRNFSNKIWNIARFVLTNLENANLKSRRLTKQGMAWPISKLQFKIQNYSEQDKEDLACLDEVVKKTTLHLDNFQFSQAGELLYNYIWHEFADKIIEESKERLRSSDQADRLAVRQKLLTILITCLKLVHPFAPFVTEAIWQQIPDKARDSKMLISSSWPE